MGGVQDKVNLNSIQLLFYKAERQSRSHTNDEEYNLTVSAMERSDQALEFESMINT